MTRWYHDFSSLGVDTSDNMRGSGKFLLNQSAKEPVIRRLLGRVREPIPRKCIDLFCSDGFYAFAMKKMWPEAEVYGLDCSSTDLDLAEQMRTELDLEVTFLLEDAQQWAGNHDFVLCAGGLYHLNDPESFLANLWHPGRQVLLQTVVDLEAREWTSVTRGKAPGCRFPPRLLWSWIENAGFFVLDADQNTLPGAVDPRDEQSLYFLLKAR